jgi:hypothetical protein
LNDIKAFPGHEAETIETQGLLYLRIRQPVMGCDFLFVDDSGVRGGENITAFFIDVAAQSRKDEVSMEGLDGIVQMLDPHAVVGHAGGERCIPLRSLPDLRHRNLGDLGDPFGGKLRGPLLQVGETVAPGIHKGLVVKAPFYDMVDHGKGKGAVCPGPDLQP